MNKVYDQLKAKPKPKDATHGDARKPEPVARKAERLHKPEVDPGDMNLGKKRGRPPKADAKSGAQRQKEYKARKKEQG